MSEVYAFGDSVLRGVIEENGKYRFLEKSFSNICENALGITVINKAKFGSTVASGEKSLERSQKRLPLSDCRYVIFEFGGNDCDFNWPEISANLEKNHRPNSTIEDFRRIYTGLIEKIKEMGKIPVLLSLSPVDAQRYFKKITQGLNKANILKWMDGNPQFITNWHERYNLEVFKLAIGNKIPVIDITSAFLEVKNYNRLLYEDGIHPNEEGHKVIAAAIKDHIEHAENVML